MYVSQRTSRASHNVKRPVTFSVARSLPVRHSRVMLTRPEFAEVRFEEVSCFAHLVFPSFPSPFLCSCHSWLRLSKRLSPSAPLLLRLARKPPVTSKPPPAPMRERTFLWSW